MPVAAVAITGIAIAEAGAQDATAIGSVDVAIWICIAPAQAAGAWFGAKLAPHIDGDILSRLLALTLFGTGASMLYSIWR